MPKIKGGYYLKARKIQESKIAHMPPHFREIWDWLIKEANHQDKKYCGFIVKRGQLFRTYQDIREGLHWMVGYRKMMYNENHTKKAMKFLRDNHMITTSKELGGVLITILNYDEYQNPKNYERTNEETIERTNEEPMKNHPIPDNNKNDKNDKNVNKKKNIKKKNPKPPESVEDVIKFFDENGYTEESAINAFKYYEDQEPSWHDTNGKPVLSWKSKMRAVWFKDENKKQGKSGVLKPTTYKQAQDAEGREMARWVIERNRERKNNGTTCEISDKSS